MINKLRNDIKDALDCRDYAAARNARKSLETARKTIDISRQLTTKATEEGEWARLERQYRQEERQLKSRLLNKMEAVMSGYRQRHEKMKERHDAEVAKIDERANDPRFSLPRKSPTIDSLMKVESFYANQGNYDRAESLRAVIETRLEHDFDRCEDNGNAQIEKLVTAMLKRHETEKNGFRQRLEMEKNKLNMEASKALLVLRNKYKKLQRRIVDDDDAPDHSVLDKQGRRIFETLEMGFERVLDETGDLDYGVSPPATAKTGRNPRVRKVLERDLRHRNGRIRESCPWATFSSAHVGIWDDV
jgi:hypothetical protein